ncbi:sirohydrochlorin chelatase [Nocardioides sp. zg-536]|uniref:Sirohydrochlorin chelatase n=1 Tax=Nocardioides faecalis TaxID=2803858 RepID=A0A939BVD0_9ACTN|nr:CbiX/SirB N-terminal domain-containing protein [Nocardioides faecalis]MBM9459806.1 sirohydrochlorin chelatase [Nocardioides faecalis]QVI58948.1 sirohydrochlorin chelatase [Nocardioides faecalis]
MPRLVTVAHGTRTAVGNVVARELTALAGERLGIEAIASYVELSEPLFADVLREPYDGESVAVPLLLSTGYHVRVDLPEAVAGAADPARVRLARPFGPDPLLAQAQVARLLEAGAEVGQPVTMVAAGSSDPAALDDLGVAASLLAEAWGSPVRFATLGGLGPRPAEVVQPGDAVSSYLLATGFFHRKLVAEAKEFGADVVADVIGPHPLAVGLLVRRTSRAS